MQGGTKVCRANSHGSFGLSSRRDFLLCLRTQEPIIPDYAEMASIEPRTSILLYPPLSTINILPQEFFLRRNWTKTCAENRWYDFSRTKKSCMIDFPHTTQRNDNFEYNDGGLLGGRYQPCSRQSTFNQHPKFKSCLNGRVLWPTKQPRTCSLHDGRRYRFSSFLRCRCSSSVPSSAAEIQYPTA